MGRRLCLAALLLSLAACREDKPLARIAVAAPFSGDMAADGPGMENPVRLALEDDAAVPGAPYRVELRLFDDKGDPAEATRAARRIAADPAVVAVIGHLTSGCSLAAAEVYAEAGLPLIAPSATSPELTRRQAAKSVRKVVFRLPASDEVQGAYAARYARDFLRLLRVGVLHDGTPYGRAIAEEFQRAFAEKGGRPLYVAGAGKGAADFSAQVAQLRRLKVEGVFYGGMYPEFGVLLKAAAAAGLKPAFLAGDGCKAPELFDIAGPAADGAYMTVSGVPIEEMPSAAEFVERYRKRFGAAPRTFAAHAYEAGLLAAGCLREVGTDRSRMLGCLRLGRRSSILGDIVFDYKGDTLKSVMTMTRADFRQRRFLPL